MFTLCVDFSRNCIELFCISDLNLSTYQKMFSSEQFTDNEKRVHLTTAAVIENATKQKVN